MRQADSNNQNHAAKEMTEDSLRVMSKNIGSGLAWFLVPGTQ